jgi:hypothetical protein
MDLHEGSVLTSRTTDSLTTASGWKQICQELRDLGISASALQENREFIKRTLSVAIENGITEDDGVDEQDLGPLTEQDRLRRESTSTLVDEEYVQRQGRLKSKHSKAVVNPDLKELSKVTDHVDGKKYSRGVAKMLRLFGLTSDERLIEAADEKDMRTVLKLIGRGANVRATDKWRWTPLHMAAYGGYPDIARLLIAHGAELDARTVDGETPLKLAERNGHAAVVQLIEEEVESRKMKELEQQALDLKMDRLELEAPEQNDFGGFAQIEDKRIWTANALVAAQVQEIELAPDEIAK